MLVFDFINLLIEVFKIKFIFNMLKVEINLIEVLWFII